MPDNSRKRGKRSRRRGRARKTKGSGNSSSHNQAVQIPKEISNSKIDNPTKPTTPEKKDKIKYIDRRRATNDQTNAHYFITYNPKYPLLNVDLVSQKELRKLSLTLVRSADIVNRKPGSFLLVRSIETVSFPL